MAVYTAVSDEALVAFLADYQVGELTAKTPIAEGVENTNYKIETTGGDYILTLYEKRVEATDLPFFMALTGHLAASKLPVAAPVKNKDGRVIGELCNRPAALIEFLQGRPHMAPSPDHCAEMGTMLANLHDAATAFDQKRANPLSLAGWERLAGQIGVDAEKCAPGLAGEIARELTFLRDAWPTTAPALVAHTDLFPDNVLFTGDKISGVIDFYFAATEFLAYDIAVCINAWCFGEERSLDRARADALMRAYLQRRTFEPVEASSFPLFLRGAALRFLLTRLYDWLNQEDGAIVTVKDPLEYRDILRFHRDNYEPAFYG